ncbi:MAG: hypothetical protein CMG94_03035 [Marinoscillum sp.]|nr:hypothetical protein [Marinoscillum sp.]OUX26883.1 MAG: hypothetical protein CBE22_01530 [Flammeovirgaceae bacterium TMED262]
MIVTERKDLNRKTLNYNVIGIVSTFKEYKVAWHLNQLFDIDLIKKKDEEVRLVNSSVIKISFLEFKIGKRHIKLISNKLKKSSKSNLISSLSNFDFFIIFSKNFFEFEDYDIIDRLKTNNTFQFANFVDINKLKDKYLLSL